MLAILFAFMFIGCGGGSDSNFTTVSGSSYKGIISNAVIEIYDFSNNTKGEIIIIRCSK